MNENALGSVRWLRTIAAGIAVATAAMAVSSQEREESIYYGALVASVTEENAPRAGEIITDYFVPAGETLGYGGTQFFPIEGDRGWTFFGPVGSAEEARTRLHWETDAAWRAALDEVLGDADMAARLVEEHLALLDDVERSVVTVSTTSHADLTGAPVGVEPTQAFYLSQTATFAGDGKARAREIIETYLLPAHEATGRAVIEFRSVAADAGFDVIVHFGRFDTPEQAAAYQQGEGQAEFIDAVAEITGSGTEAVEILEEFEGLFAEIEERIVVRPVP